MLFINEENQDYFMPLKFICVVEFKKCWFLAIEFFQDDEDEGETDKAGPSNPSTTNNQNNNNNNNNENVQINEELFVEEGLEDLDIDDSDSDDWF